MYYRLLILIVAVTFAVLAVGCGGQQNGQQKQSSQTGQASQKTTQQPAGKTTQKSKQKPHANGAGVKSKKSKGAQGVAGKAKGKGRAGKARTAKGVLGTVKIKESKVYFRPQGGKAIPLVYRPKQSHITLGGKKAQLRDLKRGQRARVTYMSRKVAKKGAKQNYRYVIRYMRAFAKSAKKPGVKQTNKANG